MILIVTIAGDLHALVVQQRLRSRGHRDCFIIECDRIAQRDYLSYGVNYPTVDRILTSEGARVSISDASVLWFRTTRSTQILDEPIEDENARMVINNDCRGGLNGLLAAHFHGKWISTPEATGRGSDKIGQLQVAHECGFRVPKTLISQSRQEVLEFFESCAGQMIVKTVVGSPGPFLQTVKVQDPASLSAASFEAAPGIYQEFIPGTDHLRLNCFGPASYAALIHTGDTDWRLNLNVPIREFAVEAALHERVRRVLDSLGLELGIVDLKLTPDGEPVWLEVNPQGQFLFLDAFTKLGLADRFAEYLLAERSAQVSTLLSLSPAV